MVMNSKSSNKQLFVKSKGVGEKILCTTCIVMSTTVLNFQPHNKVSPIVKELTVVSQRSKCGIWRNKSFIMKTLIFTYGYHNCLCLCN